MVESYDSISRAFLLGWCENRQNKMRLRISLRVKSLVEGHTLPARAAEWQLGATDAERTYLCEQAIRRHHDAS